MGSCLSKKRVPATSRKKRKDGSKMEQDAAVTIGRGSAAAAPLHSSLPPPPLPEEAVVKEVLTETSSVLPGPKSRVGGDIATVKPPDAAEAAAVAPVGGGTEDRSDAASENWSFSESFVSATPTEREEGEEISSLAPPPTKRSTPAEKTHHHRHRHQQRNDVRAGGGGGGGGWGTPSTRNGDRSTPRRQPAAVLGRDHGERSGRRSASPMAKRAEDRYSPGSGGGGGGAAVSRSSSMRKAGTASPRRGAPPGGGGATREMAAPPREHEDSVENPLVSLECFIFL